MKISFITTVFNEEKTIDKFLDSLFAQTKLPDEIIIVDGGSRDGTIAKAKSGERKAKKYKGKFIITTKIGNRSVGRNEAIKNATGDIIVCSDSGNILDKKWIENIVKPFGFAQGKPFEKLNSNKVDVVAGYYKGLAHPTSPKASKGQGNVFQKCLIPYVLVMPDKVDSENFLPATRSIAFTKAIWKKVGGFDERFSHNEDYVFANKLKEAGAKIVFAKDAIVNWIPRNTYKEAFVMFFRFALGDAEAGIWRTSVLLLFARYILVFYWIFLCVLYRSTIGLGVLLVSFLLYILWSVKKNYLYVRDKEAIKILPLLQFTADGAVLTGTVIGFLKRVKSFNYLFYIKQNKFLFFALAVYVGLLLFTLKWGIPNENHPFPYHMDEWHQLQAVANTFRYGTPNTEGSANGTMFHFLLSGFYLIPFTLLKIVDPFALQIDNLFMRERVFEVLRLQTILFGVLSIFVLYKVSEIINVSKKLTIYLFACTPIWLMLSGYFKYDIALVFWILLSLLFFLRFAKNPSNRNYLIAALPVGLAIAVKVSAAPLLIIYIFSYFLFGPNCKQGLKYLFTGIGIVVVSLLLFGFPDTLFGKGNILYYLYDNIIHSPQSSQNLQLGMHPLAYLFMHHYPIIFGHGLSVVFIFSLLVWIYFFFKEGFRKYKVALFFFFSFFIFIFTILSLNIFGGGNRSLVILPFFVIICSLTLKKIVITSRLRPLIFIIMGFVILTQAYESFSWTHIRIVKSPQEVASIWMESNIAKGETIGIENVPIYQAIPDIVQKEFYLQQYEVNQQDRYKYQIVGSKSKKLPSFIIISNDQIETRILKKSSKKDLVKRLNKEKYKKIAVFTPEVRFYKMSDVDYYFSWLVAAPNTVAVFKK